MESLAIIGMVFGIAALSYALKSQTKISELEERITKLEQLK
ncbi:MAG: hypothetical protein ACI9ES_000199 [Oceanospirillaceae bacterium]|jgi:hypothetical protein